MKVKAVDFSTLEVGKIYAGSIHKKPVKYVGTTIEVDLETSGIKDGRKINAKYLYQFEYVLPEHLPTKGKGGVCGYGQTEEQVNKECYTPVNILDLLYAPA